MPLGPEAGAVNVTVTPLTGFWKLSTTVASRGANVASIATVCDAPPVAMIAAVGPAVLVRLKLADVDAPETVALTE